MQIQRVSVRRALPILVLAVLFAGVARATGAAVEESQAERLRARMERLATSGDVPARFDFDPRSGYVATLLGEFAPTDRTASREDSARDFLTREADLFGIADTQEVLAVERTTEDIGGVVVRFAQRHDGIPVLEGGVIVGFDLDGRIVHVQNDYQTDLPLMTSPLRSAKHAIEEASDWLQVDLAPYSTPRLSIVRGDKEHPGLHLAYEVAGFLREPRGDWHVFVSAGTGEVVRVFDMLKRSGAACVSCDPTVTPACGRVFFQHPVDALDNTALTDASIVDAAQVGCVLSNLTSGTSLTGTYVNTSLTAPRIAPPYSSLRSVNEAAVDEVNVYYHVNRAKLRLNTIGFPGVMNFSINVDASDPTLGDNAHYVPSGDYMEFGQGGVDDAQDSDIVYHEYGHAIQDNQVPGFGVTDQSGAAGEGFGDYWAAALSDESAATNLGTACVGAWNATAFNPYTGAPGSGCQRRVDGAKQYPRDINFEVHDDGELWSAALWRLRGSLGAAVADPLVIKSHTYVTASARFRQLADALLTADEVLYGSTHAAAIHAAMKQQGLPRTGTAASSTGFTSNVPFVCETAHEYAALAYKECRFTQPGATRLRFHFSTFNTESGFDWVYVSDADYLEVQALSGLPFGAGPGTSATVSGDTIVVRFKADGSVQADGFRIDSVEYVSEAALPSGRVPESQTQGTPLRLVKAGTQVTLTWGTSCATTDNDYEVYEGTLGSFTSHVSASCSTASALTWTLTPAAGNRYFLVVSRNALREGSYGRTKPVAERPPSATACVQQDIAATCP